MDKKRKNCGIEEFEKCASTYRHWAKEILNAFKYNLTNGPTEGFNNKIKVLKRTSYGIRKLEDFAHVFCIHVIKNKMTGTRFICHAKK